MNRKKNKHIVIMSNKNNKLIDNLITNDYKYGFETAVESDRLKTGLTKSIIEQLSLKKGEPNFMLDFRLRSYRKWLQMKEPSWALLKYKKTNYQDLTYYSAPKLKKKLNSLDEVDPEIRKTFEKLGISLSEQKRLTNVAVDAVFDSVSIATTFKSDLAKAGVIFCPISEAVIKYPSLVKKYLVFKFKLL